jgi:hypothetical protein
VLCWKHMAFSEKQTEILNTLADYQPARTIVKTAEYLFDFEGAANQVVHQESPLIIRKQWAGAPEPIPFDPARGEFNRTPAPYRGDQLTVNLTERALILSVLRPDDEFPKVSFSVGLNAESIDIPPIFARVYAADNLNRPLDHKTEALTIPYFETVLAQSISQLGLYRQAQSLSVSDAA